MTELDPQAAPLPVPWEGQPYSVKRFGVSFTNCDSEPVQTPGCVQAHGALLVLRPSDLVILQVTENTAAVLGRAPEALLGRASATVLGAEGEARLRGLLAADPIERNPLYVSTLPRGDALPPLEVTAHTVNGVLVVELEPATEPGAGEPDYHALVKKTISRLQDTTAVQQLCDLVTADVRAVTGFDRVMVYRFHADGHGEVFAESRRADLPSWLGLHYPDDDIPKPARAIFTKIWIRPLPDVSGHLAELVPLVHPESGAPLDMTHCALRAPSVMYTEYLQNMGVTAGLTMSIRHGDELWGLIVCHHYTGPKPIPHQVRAACELLAQVVSFQHKVVEDRELLLYRIKLDDIHLQLVAQAAQEPGLAVMTQGSPTLLDGIAAGGVALHHQGRWWCAGQVPAAAELDALVDWLTGRPEFADPARALYATDHLSRDYPPAAALAAHASGLLAVPLSRDGRDLMLWFRPQTILTLVWGGDPHDRPMVLGPYGPRRTPRTSFERFVDVVRGRSLPWQVVELEAAARLRLVVRGLVVSRAERLEQLNEDLLRRNEELCEQRERLRESERRFRAVAAIAPVGIFRTDLEGNAIYVNERWLQIAGLDEAQAMGAGWASAVHPDDRAEVMRRWTAAVRARRPFAAEYRFRTPGGQVTWLIGEAVPEPAEADELTGYLGTITDITERKRFEEALRDADRRKDEFLATLAHELRNPLAPIRTGLEIMRLQAGDSPAVARVLDPMDRQLGHMIRIVDDLLDVARINRGIIELRTARISIGAVVDHAVEASRAVIEAGGHTLAVSVPAQPLWLDGDLTRLAQVVGNLLINAAKYTPRGGRIEVVATAEGAEAILRVTDNGRGIPSDMLSRIFDPFTQLESTLDRAQGGLGIGLSLVKKLVELHGGSVRAESPGPGRGSTFTVRLPLARDLEQPDAAAAPPAGPTAAPHHRRVLVVDDNVDAAEMLATMLERMGHQVTTVHTGPAALSAARDLHPDVVLLDIGLPGMDGCEVAQRLRADPALRGVMLVAITGWGSQEDQRKTQAAGFDLHLTKPVKISELAPLLARAP